jgi:hypothetical protein
MDLKYYRFLVQTVLTFTVLAVGAAMIFLPTSQDLKTTGVGFISSVFTLWFSVKTSGSSGTNNTIDEITEKKAKEPGTAEQRTKEQGTTELTSVIIDHLGKGKSRDDDL